MKMTKATIMKVLVSSLDGVGGEGGVEVKPGGGLVGGMGVAEGVVETTTSPGGEERGDGGSPSTRMDDTIVAVI